MSLEVSLRARAGDFALEVDFSAGAGITALFGPSGSGKTLTLRHLAGLARADRGRIALNGAALFDSASRRDVPARERRIGYVFQEYALFPHLSVGANVAYGIATLPRRERRARVAALLHLVELDGFELRTPQSLSGGERQRVALARALAPAPALLLLDEPFAAVDFRVRRTLRAELRSIQARAGVPAILVTHSLQDVRELAGHLVLLDRGRVVASGATEELLSAPPAGSAAELLRGEHLL